MGRGRQGETREVLIAAALHEFAQRGYQGASVSGIVARCGRTKPVLYYHFQSKPGLYRALLDEAYDSVYERMKTAVEGEARTERRLVELFRAFFQFAAERKELMRLTMASLFAAPGEAPRDGTDQTKRRRNLGLVRQLVEEAVRAGLLSDRHTVADLTQSLTGAAVYRVMLALTWPDARLDPASAEAMVRLFLDGARARPTS